MKWRGRRKSSNLEDRRRVSTPKKVVAGGGLIGIAILLFQLFGGETARELTPILEQLNQNQQISVQRHQQSGQLSRKDIELGDFVGTVLADTEDVWTQIFRKYNLGTYQKPKMVLFSDMVSSACGNANASSGPFYCPADQKVYMDLHFFEELRTRFGAKGGDFAIAYVIAHEVGHHVQTLLGTTQNVRRAQRGKSKAAANKLLVGLELQADFYAGIWAHYNQRYLEEGDIEEALSAAQAVGDDAIQKRMQGYVIPDSFTHGTSAQRMKWFMKGFKSGDMRLHDTFSRES